MEQLFTSTPFILLLVFGSYFLGIVIFMRTRLPIFHPIIISIAFIIAFLKLSNIDYESFRQGSSIINFMLGPSVVALGYTLYTQVDNIKGKVISILTSISIGSFVGIVSVIGICRLMGISDMLTVSMEPKSVTTPIAMSLSEQSGGIPALTAVMVVFCGIFGGIIGPYILRIMRIRSKVAQGLALGAAAHGLGTARAIELGAIEGAISGLAIGLMGIMTSLLIPLVHMLL